MKMFSTELETFIQNGFINFSPINALFFFNMYCNFLFVSTAVIDINETAGYRNKSSASGWVTRIYSNSTWADANFFHCWSGSSWADIKYFRFASVSGSVLPGHVRVDHIY